MNQNSQIAELINNLVDSNNKISDQMQLATDGFRQTGVGLQRAIDSLQ